MGCERPLTGYPENYFAVQPDPDPTSTVPGMNRWGWMSPAELLWLNARAQEMASIVEIGCLHGRSSIALAEGCQVGGTVWCIDPWSDDGWRSFKEGVADVYPNVRPVRAASPAAAEQVATPVDMTFIDGDHTYELVMADLEAWWPLTSRLICGHDYIHGPEAAFPDVAEAVDDFFGGSPRIQVAPGTAIWYVRK